MRPALAYLALFGGLCAALPAQAGGTFAPPPGCTLEMTVPATTDSKTVQKASMGLFPLEFGEELVGGAGVGLELELAVIEQQVGAIRPYDKIKQHLSLRTEQGGPARQRASNVVGDQSLQKA